MIVLLRYSTSWCQNEHTTISSTGELTAPNDSILISFNDLRKANAKMVELKYQKEINDSLRSIIIIDDELIREYNNKVDSCKKQIIQVKRQRNIAGWSGVGLALLLVVAIIK